MRLLVDHGMYTDVFAIVLTPVCACTIDKNVDEYGLKLDKMYGEANNFKDSPICISV